MNTIRRFLRLLAADRKDIVQIYLLSGLQGILYLLVPLGIQAVITYTMAGKFSASLILLCILTIVAITFIGLFQLWQMRINETIQERLFVNLGASLIDKIPNVDGKLYKRLYLPAKFNQLFEILTLQKGLAKILLDLSFSVISIFLCVLILPAYSMWFLLFTVLVGIAFFFVIRNYGRRSLEANLTESKYKYHFVEWMQSIVAGARYNHHPSFRRYIHERTDDELLHYVEAKSTFYKLLDLQYRSILIFKIIFSAMLLIFGVILVQSGFLNIGQFVASEILVILVINSVEKLVINLDTVYGVLTATEKLYQLFELSEHERSHGEKNVQLNELRITHETKPSFHLKSGINEVSPADFDALMLLFSTSVDGYTLSESNRHLPISDISSISVTEWQDLFYGSVAENICLELHPSSEDLQTVANLCEVGDLSSQVLSMGNNLSSPRAFAILMARMMYLKPTVSFVNPGGFDLSERDRETAMHLMTNFSGIVVLKKQN